VQSRLRNLLELNEGASGRLLPMEGLRGLAVLLVFLQHYAVQGLLFVEIDGLTHEAALWLKRHGNLGVALFFVLSGYLIYGMLLRRGTGFTPFMKRRVIRIYPTFLVVFVLYVPAHLLLGSGKIPAEPGPAIAYLVANLFLLPGVFAIHPLMSVAWTLSFEMAFYLVLALAVPGLRMRRWAPIARVALILVLAAAVTLQCAVQPNGFHPFRSFAPMLQFFVGMLLVEWEDRWKAEIPGWLAASFPVAAFGAARMLDAFPVAALWLDTLALGMLCAGSFSGGNWVARGFSWTPLRWLGNMSYSYYLFHGPPLLILFGLSAAVFGAGWPEPVFWLLIPVAFALSVAGSIVLFALVERPISLPPHRPAGRQAATTPTAGS
jgi:exopolysaccharide production protein ExoZ